MSDQRTGTTASRTAECVCGTQFMQEEVGLLGTWIPPRCSDCNDALATERQRKSDQRREEAKAEEIRAAIESSGIPRIHRDPSELRSHKIAGGQQRARACVEALCTGQLEKPWLLLTGPQGTGKTTEAVLAVHRWIELRGARASAAKPDALFVKPADYLLQLRATFDTPNKTEERTIARYSEARMLVLDDIGAENPTAFALERLFILLDRRYDDRLPTIFTSNYDPAGLSARLASRDATDSERASSLVSRIRELAVWVQFTGESHRKNVQRVHWWQGDDAA